MQYERHYLNYSSPECTPEQRGEIYAKAENVLGLFAKITTKYGGRKETPYFKAMRKVKQKPNKYGMVFGVIDHTAENIRFRATTFQTSHPYASFEGAKDALLDMPTMHNTGVLLLPTHLSWYYPNHSITLIYGNAVKMLEFVECLAMHRPNELWWTGQKDNLILPRMRVLVPERKKFLSG